MELVFRYETKFPDAAEAVGGYRVTASLVVGLMFAACTALLIGYRLNKQATLEMADELALRRAKASGQPA